jgi:ketosteroid isomerase-like protein
MIIGFILSAAAAWAAPSTAKYTASDPHPAPALHYICEAERAWAESVATGDPSTVKRILADDFIGVAPEGHLYRKGEMITDTAKSNRYFSSNVVGDVIVRFYGNTAIAQGSETWTRKSGEKGRWVWTDTWLKRNGKWQIVAAEDLKAAVK